MITQLAKTQVIFIIEKKKKRRVGGDKRCVVSLRDPLLRYLNLLCQMIDQKFESCKDLFSIACQSCTVV